MIRRVPGAGAGRIAPADHPGLATRPFSGGASRIGGCRPDFFLNGVPYVVTDPDSEFRIDRVEGIEVYTRQGMIPAQYGSARSCDVIAIWTR